MCQQPRPSVPTRSSKAQLLGFRAEGPTCSHSFRGQWLNPRKGLDQEGPHLEHVCGETAVLGGSSRAPWARRTPDIPLVLRRSRASVEMSLS